ncbi:MAG: glycoside hydrolase family 29, partial [Bacteroides sp.]|nr:glycoside hydrolase family 29 [Bacteroides sp.]
LIPEGDVKRLKEMGDEIKRRFATPVARMAVEKKRLVLELGKKQSVNYCIIQENIRKGERIRKYNVEAKVDGKWKKVCSGESVGHKRIEKFDAVEATALRLTVNECIATPDIINFSAYYVAGQK